MPDHIHDHRHLPTGSLIPTRSYCDQPYVVRTDDGAWLCCVTTGAGHEGEPGQHVTTMRSTDRGATWSTPVPVEQPIQPENSYAVMLRAPRGQRYAGRIFIFYNHNTDNIRQTMTHDDKRTITRVDSLGHYVFKFSEDGGRTWSPRRYPLDVREFACDRNNVHQGAIRFFWNVGKPFILHGAAYVPLIKVGKFGPGFFSQSEGVLLRSANLLSESDPEKIRWETLPDGDVGLRTPPGGGPIAEEASYVALSDASIHAVYRTVDGHPAESFSRDGGHTWSMPRYRRMANGRVMKHPRAANFHWRCANGKYLYWWHNHGGRFIGEHPRRLDIAYEDRNPVWLSAGVEIDVDGAREIAWSQPEIVLYDDDPLVRISYPDLIEEDGRYILTETQKAIARVHEIDSAMLEGMWGLLEATLTATASKAQGLPSPDFVAELQKGIAESMILEAPPQSIDGASVSASVALPMPKLPAFTMRDYGRADMGSLSTRAGLSIELAVTLSSLAAGQVLLDSRDEQGRGITMATTERGTIALALNDGHGEARWECDSVLKPGTSHHVVAIVDGGPRIISFVIDGHLCDGGTWRQFGWGRFSSTLYHGNGAPMARIGAGLSGRIERLRIYGRALKTFEAVALSLGNQAIT